jgi:hypothetical protein
LRCIIQQVLHIKNPWIQIHRVIKFLLPLPELITAWT